MAITPRGIRNNNPGNIEFAHQKGAVLEPASASVPKPRFAKFDTAEEGLVCLRDQLVRYYTVYRLHTVSEMINRWAPTSENNTASYVAGVARGIGVGGDTVLTVLNADILTGLMNAIIRYENGMNPYGGLVSEIAKGIDYSKLKA